MNTPQQLETRFWKALRSDMTMMLGLSGHGESHFKPMTAQLDKDAEQGPIWFFTAKNTDLVRAIGDGHTAIAQFASKGHDVFASVHGEIVRDNARATLDRLWNHFVAAWYPGGKDDPTLLLLRFEPAHAQIWLNENNIFTGLKMILGMDVKNDYQDKVAVVRLDDGAR